MDIKKIAALAIIIVVAISVGLMITTGSGEEADIEYGGQYYPGEFLLNGMPEIWENYGITVNHTLFSSGAEGNEALVSGRIDINCGSDSKTISLFNAIPDKALIIGTIQRGNRYTTIVRKDSEYEDWGDLVGKTVATRFGTGAEGVLRRYFEQSEYDWNDFDWVNVKVEDMISSLEGGQIEAFTAWAPTPAIAEAQGIGKALKSYGDVALVPASIHTTKEFAKNNREEVIKFLAAQLQKAEMIKENPEKAAQIASNAAEKKGINVSPEAFERVYQRINFQIEFDESIIQEINNTADFLYSQGKIDKKPELEWDTSYLEEAKELYENKTTD